MNTKQPIRLGTDNLKSKNKYNKKNFVENIYYIIFVKIKIMKKLIFILLLLSTNISYSQPNSIELKTYCFGNPEDNLISKLSKESRLELSNVLQDYKVDTTSFYRVKFNEIFTKYTDKQYLSVHTYRFFNWKKFDGKSEVKSYLSLNCYDTTKPNKIIILYSTNNSNIENLSVYVLN